MNTRAGSGRFGRISPADAAWLNRAEPEEILFPDLPIVDAHHHLWHVTATDPDTPHQAADRYLLDEFLADAGTGHRLVATVFIECHAMWRKDGLPAMRPLGEVEFANGQAAMADSGAFGPTRVAAGIVGFADLRLGAAVEDVLEAAARAAPLRFRGIRHTAGWDADPVIGNSDPQAGMPGLYRQPAVQDGVRRLARLGLGLDAWVYHPQLGDVLDLARACPDARIILGHCGGPLGYGPYAGRSAEVFAAWREHMRQLATCPNILVKLGGMTNRLAAYDFWHMDRPPTSRGLADLWRPYIETCIELFGPARCMFESNFPVDKMGIGYAALWNAFKHIAAGCSDTERALLFAGTAAGAYRLSLDRPAHGPGGPG